MHISSRSKVNIIVSLLVTSSFCLALVISARSAVQAAGPHISLSPNHGHPSASVKVSGRAFGISETISINFDATSVGTAITDGTGAFTTKITIPSSALPGNHMVQATGQTSGLSASTGFLVQTNWTQFGFNEQHSHFNPYENVLSSANVSGLTLDWSYTTDSYIRSSPVVVNGVIYIASSSGNLYAINLATRVLLWSRNIGFYTDSSPSVANGVVYIGSDDYRLYALNATTGTVLWTFTANLYIETPPLVASGVVYVGSDDYHLYALNATTGALLWSFSAGNYIDASPTIANGVVYVGSYDYKLYALNAKTGALLWSYATGGAIVFSSATVVNGVVYIGSNDNKLYAFNATTGTLLWTYTTGVV